MARNVNYDLLKAINQTYGSQVEFSIAIGLSQGFVSYVINGRRVLPRDHHQRWAKALGLALDEFEEIMHSNASEIVRSAS